MRILLVDDRAVVRDGLRALLGKHAITLVGERFKSACETELLRAIAAVAPNQTYVVAFRHDNLGETPTSRAATPSPPELTDRERKVLELIAEGHGSKEIAARLQIAVPTAETHRRQIMTKLGLHSVAELTKFAIREGLTALD